MTISNHFISSYIELEVFRSLLAQQHPMPKLRFRPQQVQLPTSRFGIMNLKIFKTQIKLGIKTWKCPKNVAIVIEVTCMDLDLFAHRKVEWLERLQRVDMCRLSWYLWATPWPSEGLVGEQCESTLPHERVWLDAFERKITKKTYQNPTFI